MLIELLEKDKDQYDNFVAASQSGSFLQSWEWGQWQESLGRTALRYFMRDDSHGHITSSIQLIQMPLSFGKVYSYAPYGPVLASGENSQISNFKFQIISKLPNSVFLRVEPKVSASGLTSEGLKTKNIQPGKTLLIDLTKSSDQLLREMHPKTRYNIKVAQKHGVEIKDEFAVSVGHGLFFDEAIKLILQTSRRQKFTTFPESYYRRLVDFFALHGGGNLKLHIYKAIYQNQLLSAAIMLDFGNTRTFLFGGSSEFHKNVMAPYLLQWQAMTDAQALGLNSYDFWGVETSAGDTPGFVRFKLGFGGEQKVYAGTYDLVQNKFLYKVYQLGRVVNKITRPH